MKVRGVDVTSGSLVRANGSTLQQSEDGSWEGKVTFYGPWASAPDLAPRRNFTMHPDFNSLICKSCSITQMKPGSVAKIEATYSGSFDKEDPNQDESTEEFTTSTDEAPISAHVDFTAVIGGTKAAPLNDAHFDDDGVFDGFKATSQHAGTTSYLTPSTVWKITKIETSRPTGIAGVGKVAIPPKSMTLPSPQHQWLFLSKTWSRKGAAYTVVEEYKLSGNKGWNPQIYGS